MSSTYKGAFLYLKELFPDASKDELTDIMMNYIWFMLINSTRPHQWQEGAERVSMLIEIKVPPNIPELLRKIVLTATGPETNQAVFESHLFEELIYYGLNTVLHMQKKTGMLEKVLKLIDAAEKSNAKIEIP